MTLIGAAVMPRQGQTWPDAIAEFESLSRRRLPVRRCYDGTPPPDIAASQMRFDVGVRASVYSVKPTLTTPPATLGSFAASIVAAGHPADVIIYHEPVDNMSGPDFVALYRRSAAPFREAGVPVGVCFTNWSCNLPYSDGQSALAHYWPGDAFVDFIAIDEYPTGEIPPAGSTSAKDAPSMVTRSRRVAQFADARGIPLGLAEYGVDGAWDVTKADRWLRSVADWAVLRATTGVPLRWSCYFSCDVGGSFRLGNHPEFVDAYIDGYRILTRAIKKLGDKGRLWSVPRRGTTVRPAVRRRIQRGNLVKRNTRHTGPDGEPAVGGYSFPAAGGGELWIHHIAPTVEPAALGDERIAAFLRVPCGAQLLRRRRVTGPPGEPPFQLSQTWIHPRGVTDAPQVTDPIGSGPGAWIDRLEEQGHGPIEWVEFHRGRLPSAEEASLLHIPKGLPVQEIVRVGYSAKDAAAIEVTQVVIPSDRVEEVVRLKRDESAAWPHRAVGPDGPPVAPR